METNEISMYMDAKLDIHSKRPASLKFKTWSRCMVKIEAIKCLPSFLRVTITRCPQLVEHDAQQCLKEQKPLAAALEEEPQLKVAIHVPGVKVSQTESRTKSHSYGLFWKQHRRDCFIYFAIESESSYRRHIKWIKKSIKDLELHRQLFLEQRRSSRGFGPRSLVSKTINQSTTNQSQEEEYHKSESFKVPAALAALGPLPKLPDADVSGTWSSRRVSRVSEIYEEIFDQDSQQVPRLSRRFSGASMASGIYEEMKPTATANFNAIVEEIVGLTVKADPPPVTPPPPPPRKRINTFEADTGLVGEIPRCNTNPEAEMAKKKKYKIILDSIFGGVGRSKRAESVSESATCSVEELLQEDAVDCANSDAVITGNKSTKQTAKANQQLVGTPSKRNSFSSPDLSKINFVNCRDDYRSPFTGSEDLSNSLDEASLQRFVGVDGQSSDSVMLAKAGSHESLNISAQISVNFNFSACNSSTINLVGASGANLLQSAQKKNAITAEDLTGYCVMAPVPVKKQHADTQLALRTESTSSCSGYCTGGSRSSSTSSSATSSSTNSAEHNFLSSWKGLSAAEKKGVTDLLEESGIYEKMTLNSTTASTKLYENMLAIKATQELAAMSSADPLPPTPPPKISTSTPTGNTEGEADAEESFYQTPRRSIISVDEKIPSYYPNDCDISKAKRSPNKLPTTPTSEVDANAPHDVNLRHMISAELRHERKENYQFLSSQKSAEKSPLTVSLEKAGKSKANKSKKTTAHKISEHIYNVAHVHSKKSPKISNSSHNSPTVNPTESSEAARVKLQRELLQLVALQNIDFKFDDFTQTPPSAVASHPKEDGEEQQDESCFHAKIPTPQVQKISKSPAATTVKTTTHHLQQSQQANLQQHLNTASPREQDVAAPEIASTKKFASLPRFKKIDFSPLRMRINNVLQRTPQQQQQQ